MVISSLKIVKLDRHSLTDTTDSYNCFGLFPFSTITISTSHSYFKEKEYRHLFMGEECSDDLPINFTQNNLTVCFRESHSSKIIWSILLPNSFKFSLNIFFYSITFHIRPYAIHWFPIKIISFCLPQVLGRICRTDRKSFWHICDQTESFRTVCFPYKL